MYGNCGLKREQWRSYWDVHVVCIRTQRCKELGVESGVSCVRVPLSSRCVKYDISQAQTHQTFQMKLCDSVGFGVYRMC